MDQFITDKEPVGWAVQRGGTLEREKFRVRAEVVNWRAAQRGQRSQMGGQFRDEACYSEGSLERAGELKQDVRGQF